MGKFNFEKYDKKAKKRHAWEEKVARYGLEVAKIITKHERTASTYKQPHAQSNLFNKRYKVPQ